MAKSATKRRRRVKPKRGLRAWLRRLGRSNRLFPRKLQLTLEGKFLIGITLGVGFAAINTGNNLLYLILGMLLSLMIVSGILSELTLRGLLVEREGIDPLTAGHEGLMKLRLSNEKRMFSSFSVELTEVFEEPEEVAQVPAYTLRLEGRSDTTSVLRMSMQARGEYRSIGLAVATRFPFSFFRKSRYVPSEATYLVHPRTWPVPISEPDSHQQGAEAVSPRRGASGDVYGLRDYRFGDEVRDVHWKATARRRRYVAKEYERPAARALVLQLPTAAPDSASEDALEDAIERTASIAVSALAAHCRVGLVTHHGSVEVGDGAGQTRRILDHLARLLPKPVTRLSDAPPLAAGPAGVEVVGVEWRHGEVVVSRVGGHDGAGVADRVVAARPRGVHAV